MTPLFTLPDVTLQLGEHLDELEAGQVGWFIERAESELRRSVPLLDDRLASGELDPVLVKGVGVDLVIAALDRMRTGLRVKSEAYPEISTSYVVSEAAEMIGLTDAQIAKLSPDVAQSTVFNLSMSGGQ